MYPSINGLNDNLAHMMKARDRRVAQESDIHGQPARMVGGPLPDPAWDAWFGALNDQADQAASAGYGFHVNTGALAGLRNAIRR